MTELVFEKPAQWRLVDARRYEIGDGATAIIGPLRLRRDDQRAAENELLRHDLPPGYAIESEERTTDKSTTGWPMTVVWARARADSDRGDHMRLLVVFQILEHVAAILVVGADAGQRASLLAVLRTATPGQEVSCASDLYRDFGDSPFDEMARPEATAMSGLSAIWCD